MSSNYVAFGLNIVYTDLTLLLVSIIGTLEAFMSNFSPKESGTALVEYALLVVFIAVVTIAVLVLVGPSVGDVFSNIVEGFSGA